MNTPQNPSQEKSSGQQVTLPYKKPGSRKELTMLLEINSRDRNILSYPNPSQFRIRLYRPLKDIVKMQIAGGTIPGCLYNINVGWNVFTFQEGTTQWNVTIPPGKYVYDTLCNALASVLNGLTSVANTYAVNINGTTGRMEIQRKSGTASFAILFLTGITVDFYDQNNTLVKINTPAKLFGFGRADYSNTGDFIRAPNVVDLDFLLNRCYLYINHDNTQDLNVIERSVGRAQPYGIIYFDELHNNYKFLNKETYEPLFYSYPAPISRIATLDISIQDEFDRLVDFNGRDFTLLLEVVTLE
jgi:hypothetical protein